MADSSLSAIVDGRQVELEINDAQIQWTEEDDLGQRDSKTRSTTIDTKNIIAAIATPTSSPDQWVVLHTVWNKATKGDAKSPPYLLESHAVSALPKQFLDIYEPRSGALWPLYSRNDALIRLIRVVVSVGSGTGLAPAVWQHLVQPLLSFLELRSSDYTVVHTTSENSITDLVRNTILPTANDGEDQCILLLSGDGGIVDIVNALLSNHRTAHYKNPTIALLPLGTGNALANSAVLGDDNTMGFRTLLLGSSKSLPLFRATFSPGARLLVDEGRNERELEGVVNRSPVAVGAVVCSWGLHATLVADSDTAEYRKYGAERFKMAANEALFPSDGSLPHAYRGQVSILRPNAKEWEQIPEQEHGYVLATLVQQLEAGFTISPDAQPLDGKLRLVYFGHVSGKEATEIMTAAYQGGKHVGDGRVRYEEIDALRVHFDEDDQRWRRLCIDGKIIRVEKGGWVEVRRFQESVVDLVARPS